MLLHDLINGLVPAVHPKDGADVRSNGATPDVDLCALIREASARLQADAEAKAQREYELEMRESLRIPLEGLLATEIVELAEYTPATQRVYAGDIKRFKQFCDQVALSFRPATPETVSHFLLQAASDGASISTINRLSAAIAWAHDIAECFNPTSDILVRATVRYLTKHKANGHSVNGANGVNGSANAQFEGAAVPDDEPDERIH